MAEGAEHARSPVHTPAIGFLPIAGDICDLQGDFAVVSHAPVCRALVDRCMILPEELIPADGILFSTTAINVVDSDTNTVTLLGCTAHLSEDQITYPNHPKGM